MTGRRRTSWIRVLAAQLAIVVASASEAAAVAGDEIATLEAASGRVSVIRLGQARPSEASMVLRLHDVVVTREGRVTVRFHSDGTVLRVGPDSRVQIDETATQRDVTVFFGRLWAHVVRWKERPTRFITDNTIVGMRGTELNITVDGEKTQLSVLEGQVLAENDAGSLMVAGGQVAIARKGSVPALSLQVRPQDAVRWALYYLPVLSLKPGELGEGADEQQAKLRESTEAYQQGDLMHAISSLESVETKDIRDPRFFTYRASLRLATGKVEEAGKDLEQALALAPNDSDALALQTVVAVAENQDSKAVETAQRAVAAGPKSATARIAQSYARQAKFDLEGARESLETAVKLDAGDALAWARLAEILSSLGQRSAALEAAEKAVALAPNLSRTQTVLGYSYLTQVKTLEAKHAFEKAIEFDTGDPLPRLGLGLAKIREGDLAEGTREIEVAVSLDPGQSLLRSYLGKAYFEAKRGPLDEREYKLAQEADPKDPTSRLYDAIAKQTTNRPVEALGDNQEAIDLNDNRGVYRSRLLLDQDLAARSASLGRIYSDLGFQPLALVEGWNSIGTDPGNYSAHRLLADSYATLPRHEIARVSELFQSQMLQPLNTTSIQPRLGESSLFLLSAEGPGSLAFNEFNPLFNRDQVNLQGSFLAGEDSTWTGEGILSGIYKKLSFSTGYSAFKTDGFRENNSQDDQIANAFAQVELSPGTSIQTEVRYRNLEKGDRNLNFLENDFSPTLTERVKSTSARAGLRQDFGAAVTLLASYIHQDADIDFGAPEAELSLDFRIGRKEKGDGVEGQLLFRSPRVKVVAGSGYFATGSDERIEFSIDDPIDGFTSIATTERNIRHTNLYAYSYFSLPKNVTLTLGVSGNLFDESGKAFSETRLPGVPPEGPVPAPLFEVLGNLSQFNPKAGITWRLESGTTLRGAWFGAMQRTLVADQTLEPTQVAGFNQFFEDSEATVSKVYGLAIDQMLGKKVFAGAEYSYRNLEIPYAFREPDRFGELIVSLKQGDGHEDVARAYLFAAPHPWLTFGAEYQYENLERDPGLFFPFQKVKTHRVPLSARFFHPSGWSAFVGVTHLDQDGEFLTFSELGENEYVPGQRSFWVVDAALRYRLPKRYGFIVAGVNNLTDERSTYYATDSRNLSIRPGRFAYARVVLAFP